MNGREAGRLGAEITRAQAGDPGRPKATRAAQTAAARLPADRLGRLRDLLDARGLDAVLVSDPTDVRYLSGFRGEDTTLLVGS